MGCWKIRGRINYMAVPVQARPRFDEVVPLAVGGGLERGKTCLKISTSYPQKNTLYE